MKHPKTTAATTLSGCHVVVTHTQGCTRLQQSIQTLEGTCSQLPLLDIKHKPLSQFQYRLSHEADTWVFLSRNSITATTEQLRQIHEEQKIVAIGPATAHSLETNGLQADHIPNTAHNSEGISALPLFQEKKRRVVIFSEAGASSPLIKLLKQQGHFVKQVSTYQHIPTSAKAWHEAWIHIADITNAVTTHSLKGLSHLITCHQQYPMRTLHEKTLVVTTHTMQKMAQSNGFVNIILSASNAPNDICNALIDTRPRRMS